MGHSKVRSAVSTVTVIVVIVILVVVAGAGYYYYTTTTPGSSTSGPTEIKIGMTMPLSGSLSSDGIMSLDGLKLWAHNVNASGGIYVSSLGRKLPVHLIYSDDTSSSSVVATDYQQLVSQGVNFLIAPYSSGLTLAAAPIAESAHLLLLSHGGASDSIFSKGYKYVVQILSPGSQYDVPVLQMLMNENSSAPIKVALFYGQDSFSLSVETGASAFIAQNPGKFNVVYNQTYDESASSYTTQLSQIASANPDVIIGGAHFADGENIMRGIQSLGLHFKMVSLLVAPDDPHFLSDLGSLANNVVAPAQWEANLDFTGLTPYYGNITGPQFLSQFQSTFNMAPNYEAAEAYATGLTLQKAIYDSGSLNSTVVRNQMSTENFYTFYGHFQIGATGIQTGHTMVVMQWQNGVKQTVWPKVVATAPFVYPAP